MFAFERGSKRLNSLQRARFVLRHTMTDPGEVTLLPNANCAIPCPLGSAAQCDVQDTWPRCFLLYLLLLKKIMHQKGNVPK